LLLREFESASTSTICALALVVGDGLDVSEIRFLFRGWGLE
jgi:hypothetical protein